VDILAISEGAIREVLVLSAAAEAAAETPFQINLFWVLTQAASFVLFLVIVYLAAFRRIGGVLEDRRQRIEQGLKDAEQARRDREQGEQERLATLAEARREAQEILNRAQKLAQESRDADIVATKEELEKMRVRAAADIEAEKQRAIAELRTEVADLALAAASKVLGESVTDARQKRLVEEFLREAAATERRG
jgi:F-type H+-transporting ATPase subunit b